MDHNEDIEKQNNEESDGETINTVSDISVEEEEPTTSDDDFIIRDDLLEEGEIDEDIDDEVLNIMYKLYEVLKKYFR